MIFLCTLRFFVPSLWVSDVFRILVYCNSEYCTLVVWLIVSPTETLLQVEWLKRNDAMAQQIALNAANYGKSYLRLEDYLCYAASSLRLIHDVEKDSDVLEGFNPQRINRTSSN